jgi:hypothetical protein
MYSNQTIPASITGTPDRERSDKIRHRHGFDNAFGWYVCREISKDSLLRVAFVQRSVNEQRYQHKPRERRSSDQSGTALSDDCFAWWHRGNSSDNNDFPGAPKRIGPLQYSTLPVIKPNDGEIWQYQSSLS